MAITRRTMLAASIVAPLVEVAAHAATPKTAGPSKSYFPPPDTQGGWRRLNEPGSRAGLNVARLDDAFEYVKTSCRHGGLLALRSGYLVYERYFGRANREAHPNMHSIGKMFTSTSCGIMLSEHKDRFPDGLSQKVFTPEFLPEAFPLGDPRMANIRFGNLLTMTSGMSRASFLAQGAQAPATAGHSTGIVHGENVDVPNWYSSDPIYDPVKSQDACAVQGRLWTAPGEGYLYGRDPHAASMILRRVVGMELQEFIRQRMAEPMGFGSWGYSTHQSNGDLPHTPGESAIALRSTDILRFGYMLLNRGIWAGRQMVPASYIEMLSHPSPFNIHSPFSLQFEVNTDGHVPYAPRDAFFKSGAGGCALYVIPSLDMVIYKMGEADDPMGTGLPPAPNPNPDSSRDNWRAHPFNQFMDGPVDGDTGVRRTLGLVSRAIIA